jgi:uncharacterized repeat protein (TIGR02543 family)
MLTGTNYTVTFDTQGGSTPIPSAKVVTTGSTYGLLATTGRSGYTFAGWWTAASGGGAEVTSATPVMLTAAQTLYAKWNPTVTSRGTPLFWLDQYRLVSGGDYEASDTTDKDGDGQAAWQEYIAGTVPTNSASVFKSEVTLINGLPWVTWTPDLGTGRVYTVEGRTNLTSGAWGATNSSSRFFRVKVAMP